MTAGGMVNKLVDAEKSGERAHMTADEQVLLIAAQQEVKWGHPTLQALARLSLPAEYPDFSKDQIPVLWLVLSAHIVLDE